VRVLKQKQTGFTVVELIIVIVVIAILVGVTIVGYGAWRKGVAESAMESDISQATSQIESYRQWNNTYPNSSKDVNGGKGLDASEGNTLTYLKFGPAFCVQATSTGTSKAMRYTSTTKTTEDGKCELRAGTVAGSGTGASVDGSGSAAQFYRPLGVALSPDEKTLYVVDSSGNKIRKVTLASQEVATLAGSGTYGFADGVGAAARFSSPSGIAVDKSGAIFVADCNNQRIRKILPDGTVSTYAGSGSYGFQDGSAATARFWCPSGIAVDDTGAVYVADSNNHRVRKISVEGNVTTVAGAGTAGYANGAALSALLNRPKGLVVDKSGNVYISDSSNNRIRKLSADGQVTTVVGDGTAGNIDGIGEAARISSPQSLTIDASGSIIFASSNFIRMFTPSTGAVTTILSAGGGYADGVGDAARLLGPDGVAMSSAGLLYVSDTVNNRIRTVSF